MLKLFAYLDLFRLILGEISDRRARRVERRLDRYGLRVEVLTDIRDRWKAAEENKTGLVLTPDDIAFVSELRKKIL